MAKITKSVPVEDSWSWRNDGYEGGVAVRCTNHQFAGENRSFVNGTIEPGENHGWSTAMSDYYYLITSGSATIEISDSNQFAVGQSIEVKAGDCFTIKSGTTYNYRAGTDGLTFVLFMNNLWVE